MQAITCSESIQEPQNYSESISLVTLSHCGLFRLIYEIKETCEQLFEMCVFDRPYTNSEGQRKLKLPPQTENKPTDFIHHC